MPQKRNRDEEEVVVSLPLVVITLLCAILASADCGCADTSLCRRLPPRPGGPPSQEIVAYVEGIPPEHVPLYNWSLITTVLGFRLGDELWPAYCAAKQHKVPFGFIRSNLPTVPELLNESLWRSRVHDFLFYVDHFAFDGFQLDWEQDWALNASVRAGLSDVVVYLAEQLKTRNVRFTATIPSSFYPASAPELVVPALAETADLLMLMEYGSNNFDHVGGPAPLDATVAQIDAYEAHFSNVTDKLVLTLLGTAVSLAAPRLIIRQEVAAKTSAYRTNNRIWGGCTCATSSACLGTPP